MKSLKDYINRETVNESVPAEAKFVVLFTGERDGKSLLKWGKCSTKEEVDDCVETFETFYGKGDIEVYEVKKKIK